MNIAVFSVNLLFYVQTVLGRDFYLGLFRRDDYLVAQDNIFKQKRPYSYVIAEYGRLFKCPISYFRVVDRLGMTGGPTVRVLKGGLKQKYIVVRINSQYNLPISVNVYVGCHNNHPRLPKRPIRQHNNTVTQMTTVKSKNKKTVVKHIETTTKSHEMSPEVTKTETEPEKDANKADVKTDKNDVIGTTLAIQAETTIQPAEDLTTDVTNA